MSGWAAKVSENCGEISGKDLNLVVTPILYSPSSEDFKMLCFVLKGSERLTPQHWTTLTKTRRW